MNSTNQSDDITNYKIQLETISSFSTPIECYALTIGKITKDIPQLVLSCYKDNLLVMNPDGNLATELEWSTNFTCVTIGKLAISKNIISGSLDGTVRVMNSRGALIWTKDLGLNAPIKNITIGNMNGTESSQLLVATGEINVAILLDKSGEILWKKQMENRIVGSDIGVILPNGNPMALIFEANGTLNLINLEGEIVERYNFNNKVANGLLMSYGNLKFIITTEKENISFWKITDKLNLLFSTKWKGRIRKIYASKIFDSENDCLAIMTKNGEISISRVIVTRYDEDRKAFNAIQYFDPGVSLEKLRSIILDLLKSFGVAGIPINRIHQSYIERTKSLVSYQEFYKDLLAIQSSGKLGGRIDTSGTPDTESDDILIINTDKFFCMACNGQYSVLSRHSQCDQCLRFLCEECYSAREAVGFIECPYCQASASHFRKIT